jgi:SOS-response transcriptional repressor LexA
MSLDRYQRWIAEGLKRPNKSQMGLAAALGITQPRVSEIIRGKRKVKSTEIPQAASYLGMPPPDQLAPELFEVGEIPVIGEVAAGLWMEVADTSEEPLEMLPFVPALSTKASYALRVRGDSVDKIAPDGSYVICADIGITGAAIENDDLVIVERLQAQGSMREVTVKRVRLKKDGIVLLPESTNSRWKPVEINSHNTSPEDVDVRVIAHVVWIARRPA